MTLRWRLFEEEMTRRIARRLDLPGRWRTAHRRLFHGSHEVPLRAGLLRCFFIFMWLVYSSARTQPLNLLVGMALLWSVGSVFWRASQLQKALYYRQPLEVFLHLPISDADIFRARWQGFLWLSTWSILDFSAVYGVLANRVGCLAERSFLVGLGFGLGQWLVLVSAATCLTAWWPRGRFYKVSVGMMAAAIGLFFVGARHPTLSQWVLQTALWVPPVGWIIYALGISPDIGFIAGLGPALTTALIALALPRGCQRLKANYRIGEPPAEIEPKRAPKPAASPASAGIDPDANPHAALKAAIRRREFLTGFDWQRGGWLERAARHWLTPDEKLTAEFLTAGNPKWTTGLRKSGLICMGLIAAILFLPSIFRSGAPFIFVIFYLPSVLVTQAWRGLGLVQLGDTGQPLYSAYPVGFRQMLGVMLKVGALRLLILMPPLAALAYWIGTRQLGETPQTMVGFELRVGSLLVGLIPVYALLNLSSGTDDSKRFKFGVLALMFGLFVAGCGVALFFTRTFGFGLAMLALLSLSLAAAIRAYGYAYDHGWFDLQAKPKETKPPAKQ